MGMTWREICSRRLTRHGLVEPVATGDLVDRIGTICGAHAQVMSAAELSIGLRVAGVTRAEVRAALWDERTLVKTYGPRGTVHLLPSRDLPMWTGALAAVPAPSSGLPPDVRLTPGQTDAVVGAIADALSSAELTLDELNEAVVRTAGPWAGDRVMPAFGVMWPRWRQAVHVAAQRGVLCFGPSRGSNVTYTSPRHWLPGFEPMDPGPAIAELVRRYLVAYGPATSRQFGRWLGIPSVRTATALFEDLSGDLERTTVGDAEAWVVAGDAVAGDAVAGSVRLLPYFDAYVVGCHPRELLFPGQAIARALAGGQAGTVPVLLVDGVVAGVWHQRRAGRTLTITVEPFGRLSAAQRHALDGEVERIGEILEGSASWTIGPVTAGKHA